MCIHTYILYTITHYEIIVLCEADGHRAEGAHERQELLEVGAPIDREAREDGEEREPQEVLFFKHIYFVLLIVVHVLLFAFRDFLYYHC